MRHTVAILETIARGHVAILENDEKFVTRYPSRMLSEWLRNAMKAAGMSQAQLARELTDALGRSIDRAAVNKMLSNGRKISADELVAITRILNTDAPSDPAHPAPDLRWSTCARSTRTRQSGTSSGSGFGPTAICLGRSKQDVNHPAGTVAVPSH